MINLGFDSHKFFSSSKSSLLPLAITIIFFVYFFSVPNTLDLAYYSLHLGILISTIVTIIYALISKQFSIVANSSIIYVTYIIISASRYASGEDYVFSVSYNVWSLLLFANIVFIYFLFSKFKSKTALITFYLVLFSQTSVIEYLQVQNTDAHFFYKHIGAINYPTLFIATITIITLAILYIAKGKILSSILLYSSISLLAGICLSDDLFAFSLFFFAASLTNAISGIYLTYVKIYEIESLHIPSEKSLMNHSKNKYPLKYSLVLVYLDDYNRIKKRFGKGKMNVLKKMILSIIKDLSEDVTIYGYKEDSFILSIFNKSSADCYEIAESIRRGIAKTIFVFNENNHLQLTISQCVSEKKRRDGDDASNVLQRAEENLQKACKFTRNITLKC